MLRLSNSLWSRTGAWLRAMRPAVTSVGLVIPLALTLVSITILPTQAQVPVPLPEDGANVLTYHNDNARTGQNLNETKLTPANVKAQSFGKLFTRVVDGAIYAQPLYVSNLAIPGKGAHNVVFVATAHNSVYAFDADSNNRGAALPLWQVNFNNNLLEINPVPSEDVLSQDIFPEIGIIGTPVIDLDSKTLYVVVKTKERNDYFQRLHALSITTGAERDNSPIDISANVPGTGDGSSFDDLGNSIIPFYTLKENQRPALLLSKGVLWIGWASHGDNGPYHGWILGYDPQTLQQVAVFNTTPNGGLGGIWQAGAGPAADADGNIFLMTGNGTFTAADFPAGSDYGDSFLKLSLGTGGLGVTDFFTPFNQEDLNLADEDLGSGGPLLLPDSVGSADHPHLLVGAGKEGKIYLVDRDRMGNFNIGFDDVVQSVTDPNGEGTRLWGMPAYFNGHIYLQGVGDFLKSYSIAEGVMSDLPDSQSLTKAGFPGDIGYPGATPSISANVDKDGIVWTTEGYYLPTPAPSSAPFFCPLAAPRIRLHAYDAKDVSRQLYSAMDAGSRDLVGLYTKFTVPTVANGKVYVGGDKQLNVYGPITNPKPLQAERFVISGAAGIPLTVSGFCDPLFYSVVGISQNVAYHFNVTAVGPDGKPIKLNSTVFLVRSDGSGLHAIGTLRFNNESNLVFSRSFPDPGFFNLIVTDTQGHTGTTLVINQASPRNGDPAQGGVDHYLIRAPRTARDGERVALTFKAVTSNNTPVQAYALSARNGLPIPLDLFIYDTIADGTQDLVFLDTLPSWYEPTFGLDLDQPVPNPDGSNPATLFFETQKTVLVTVRKPGKHIFVVSDGGNTGTVVIEVPRPR